MKERPPGPSVLILSDLPAEESRRASEIARFGAFVRALERGGFEAAHRFMGTEGELRSLLRARVPALAFCASLRCAKDEGEPRMAHAVLEEEGVAYVGSDPAALELAIDKAALKERWLRSGVRTPPFCVVDMGLPFDEERAAEIGFPCIVKPNREGNSRGIGEDSVARALPELRSKAELVAARFGSAIAERFLGDAADVREFTVALIGSGDGALVLPAEIELAAPKAVRVITTADKDGHRTVARPVADPALRRAVADFARRAFAAAGVRDYSRFDLIMAGGELYAIEINGQPMVPDAWFAACASGAGLDEAGYLNAIALAALARAAREGRAAARAPDALRELIPRAAYEALDGGGRRE